MPTVHLCDPQLSGQGGHYLNHDAQLIRDLHRRGFTVRLYGRRGATVTCEGLTPMPVFSEDIFKETASDAHVWALENFDALNRSFAQDLAALPVETWAAEDLVYFPNLIQNQLHGIALWLAGMPASRRPAVAIMLRYLNHAMDYLKTRSNKELLPLQYRFAARALKAVQPRSLLCADTRELAGAYRQITGLPVCELPNPMDVSALLQSAPRAAGDERPVIVYQGHTSPLRGFHFLPDIIERCQRTKPRPRFIVQVQNRAGAAGMGLGPALARLDRLATGPDVRLVEGALGAEEYFNLLAAADVVLLPYSPTFYGFGSSGVFTESASVGKVVVVSPDTVPARQGAEFDLGVVKAAQWTPQAMADAVLAALRDLPSLQARAVAGAERFRAEQCAAVLWDRVLAEMDKLAGSAASTEVVSSAARAA